MAEETVIKPNERQETLREVLTVLSQLENRLTTLQYLLIANKDEQKLNFMVENWETLKDFLIKEIEKIK